MTKKLKDYGMEQTHIVLKNSDLVAPTMLMDKPYKNMLLDVLYHYGEYRKSQDKDPDPEYLVS